MVYRFGAFVLDTASFRLLHREDAVSLTPQCLDVLSFLVRRPRVLVTKQQLFQAVWRDVVVTDNALTQVISDLREALGDDPAKPEYIETVARRGYRFIASVSEEGRIPAVPSGGPHRPRETPSLDAYRLFSEGRILLESLDSSTTPLAIDKFRHAIELDPGYAPPYIGLANALFWQHEQTRYRVGEHSTLLDQAILQARCAQRIDGLLAEAHATLAYLLTAAERFDEARAAARRALVLEPNRWEHHFRLANATWGEERLAALQRCCELYAEFPFAYFQVAMVHVARYEFALAEQTLCRGITIQEGDAARRRRFPANGLHWLRGLMRMCVGDLMTAVGEFDREVQSARGQLYATEFEIAARTSWGFALLGGDLVDQAIDMFRASLDVYDVQPRAHLGLARAFARANQPDKSEAAIRLAENQIGAIERAGRASDAALFRAGAAIARGRPAAAVPTLGELLAGAPPGPSGWLIPIEPLLSPLREDSGHARLLAQLASRAR